jgi:hypothetical protein
MDSESSSLYNIPVKHFKAKFSCLQPEGDRGVTAPKHPDAVKQTFELYLTDAPTGDSDEIPIKVRLYPGGIMAVLVGDHACASTCSDERNMRILFIDWHHGCIIGVSETWLNVC